MSWRIVVITQKAKLSYKNNYMLIRNEQLNMVHLSEIHTLLIDSTLASITTHLMCELIKRKIKVVFCDEKRNPIGEMTPYYGSHNTSKKIMHQIKWKTKYKQLVWTAIVHAKIGNQIKVLERFEKEGADKLRGYQVELERDDATNREAHAAKVYFNNLFGKDFTRDEVCECNAALDYGYAILLSTFNKEIVSNGYLTQLGIKHKSEFNFFNLSSDLMEPFRPLIDSIVYQNKDKEFGGDYKMKLVGVLNQKILLEDKEQYVSNAISQYVKNIFNALEWEELDEINFYEWI